MANAPTLTTDGLTSASGMGGNHSGASAGDMLQMLFGEVAKNPIAALDGSMADSTVLSILFMYLNIGLLTLGSVYLTYKTLSAIVSTTHDGEFMGKALHTVWVPLRITTGVLGLSPVAGGWSAFQIFSLWVGGVMGAGLGNLAWQATVDAWLNGAAKKTNVALFVQFSGGEQLTRKAFEVLLCNNVNKQMDGASNTEANRWVELTPNTNSDRFGQDIGSNNLLGVTRKCGGWYVAKQSGQSGKKKTIEGDVASVSSTLTHDMFMKVDGVAAQAAKEIVDNVAAAKDHNKTAPLPDFKKYVAQVDAIGKDYQGRLSSSVYNEINSAAKRDDMAGIISQSAKEYGFTSAGSFYTAYANSSYSLNSASNAFSAIDVSIDYDSVNKMKGTSDSGSVAITQADQYWQAAIANKTPNTGNAAQSNTEQGAFGALMDKMGAGWIGNPGERFIAWFANHDGTAPALVNIKNTADNVVLFAGAGMTAAGALKGWLNPENDNLYTRTIKRLGGAGLIGATTGAVNVWIDMFLVVAQIAIGFFLMCSIYLPLVPYIVFTGQVLEWLASVMLGVIAAPFLAFAHFDTDGEGLGAKTQHGYGFMLQSFIRPLLLVIGFVVSAAMIEVSIRFLTITYGFAVHDVQVHSMTGLFSIIGYCALYMVLAVGMVNTSCTLMYLLPDAVLQFMGVQSVGMGFGRSTLEGAAATTATGAGISRAASVDLRTRSKDVRDAQEAKRKRDKEAAQEVKNNSGGGVNGSDVEKNP